MPLFIYTEVLPLFKWKSKAIAQNGNYAYLGEKRVEIKKLTPNKWRQLFQAVDNLPGIIVQVLTAPQDDFYAYVLVALDEAVEEIVQIVAALSNLDVDYITENVGFDEIVDYLAKTVKKNNLDAVLKNVKSLLPKAR